MKIVKQCIKNNLIFSTLSEQVSIALEKTSASSIETEFMASKTLSQEKRKNTDVVVSKASIKDCCKENGIPITCMGFCRFKKNRGKAKGRSMLTRCHRHFTIIKKCLTIGSESNPSSDKLSNTFQKQSTLPMGTELQMPNTLTQETSRKRNIALGARFLFQKTIDIVKNSTIETEFQTSNMELPELSDSSVKTFSDTLTHFPLSYILKSLSYNKTECHKSVLHNPQILEYG